MNLMKMNGRLRNQAMMKPNLKEESLKVIEIFLREEVTKMNDLTETSKFVQKLQRCFKIPSRIQKLLYAGVEMRSNRAINEEAKEYAEEFSQVIKEAPEFIKWVHTADTKEVIDQFNLCKGFIIQNTFELERHYFEFW